MGTVNNTLAVLHDLMHYIIVFEKKNHEGTGHTYTSHHYEIHFPLTRQEHLVNHIFFYVWPIITSKPSHKSSATARSCFKL